MHSTFYQIEWNTKKSCFLSTWEHLLHTVRKNFFTPSSPINHKAINYREKRNSEGTKNEKVRETLKVLLMKKCSWEEFFCYCEINNLLSVIRHHTEMSFSAMKTWKLKIKMKILGKHRSKWVISMMDECETFYWFSGNKIQ